MISENTASEAMTTRKGTRAFEIVFLFPIAHRPHQQRRAHHAVEHDHQGGEHGVAGKGRVFSPCRMIAAMSETSMTITRW